MTWVLLLTISAFGLSTYLGNSYAGQKIKTQYLQAFEKKYWAELDTFHAGNTAVARDYFDEVYASTVRLASFGPAASAVAKNDVVALGAIIDQQHDVTDLVSGLYVLDKNGVVIAEKIDSDPQKLQVGTSAANQPYFKRVTETKKPSASQVFLTQKEGAAAINFCAPFLSNQELQAIVCSGVRLAALNTHLQTAAIKTDFATFKSLVTDTKGNIIFEDNQTLTKTVNISEDRAVAALIAGADMFRDEEINFQQVETFVEASRVNLGTDGGVFVISYLPKSEVATELAALDATLSRTYTGNGFRSLLLTLLACAVIYRVIRKHDEETTDH